MAGLNIGDVQILGSRGSLHVHRTYDVRHGLSESPKTSRSNRHVRLVPTVVPLLADYLAERRALSPQEDGEPDKAYQRRLNGSPLFLGRKVGGSYMNDWAPPANPLLTPEQRARAEEKALAKITNAEKREAQVRPFDPAKRFDPMTFYKRVWVRAVAMAEVEHLRVHDLRHTAAALMLSSGMPLTMVSRQLGHESANTTDTIYGGLLVDAVEEAVDGFGDWLTAQGE